MALTTLVLPVVAQNWSGILDPSRAIDWTQVPGVTFTIPSGSWTQCVTAACNTVTSNGSSSTIAQINSAIASAPANSYIFLPSGTYSFSSCIDWQGHGHVVLRGNGPLSTIVKFTAGCGAYSGNGNVLLRSNQNSIFDCCATPAAILPGGSNALTLTGTSGSASGGPTGANLYPQGATQITVSGVGTDTPVVGTMLFIDQANDTAVANGWLQCNKGNPANDCSNNGGAPGRAISGVTYSQVQAVVITNIAGSTYTISPGLYANNMRSSQTPGAWWNTSSALCTQCGVENVTLDATPEESGCPGSCTSSITEDILFFDCYQCWMKNVREITGGTRNHIYAVQSSTMIIRDSYFFGGVGLGNGTGYGIDPVELSDCLVENNIADEVPAFIVGENYSGCVEGYNMTWNNIPQPHAMNQTFPSHDPGSMMNLYEGNFMNGVSQDTQHGGSPVFTYFRDQFEGQQPIPNDTPSGTSTFNEETYELQPLQHGENIVANVLGILTCAGGANVGRPADQPSQCPGSSVTGAAWQTGYEGSAGNADLKIYDLGFTGTGTGTQGTLNADANVKQTLMRWGNYDTVTGAVRWCGNSSDTGWVAVCGSTSEIPTTAYSFFNGMSVPTKGDTGAGQGAFPASFYRNSKPAFFTTAFGNVAWPPIGPDVAGGDLAGVAGHANRIPARVCFENTGLDSTNYPSTNIKAFDWTNCQGAAPSGPNGAARGVLFAEELPLTRPQ